MKRFFSSILLVLALAVAFPVTAWASSSPVTNSVYEQSLYTGWRYNANNNSFNSNGGASVSYNKTLLDLLLNNFKGINYQLSNSSNPSTSGTSLYTLINNILSSLTSTSNGTILSYLSSNSQKLSQINTTLGTGTTLKNVMSNLDDIVSWTAQTYNILQHGIDVNFDSTTFTNISNTAVNTSDTAVNTALSASSLEQILNVVKRTNGKFFEYYSRSTLGGDFSDVTISTSETYGTYHANGDGSYQISSLSGVQDRLEFLAWLHSDLLNVMGMLQTPNTIYTTGYTSAEGVTSGAISLSIQDSIVLGNQSITDTLSKIYNERKNIDWIDAGSVLGVVSEYNSTNYISSDLSANKLYAHLSANLPSSIAYVRVPITTRILSNIRSDIDISFYYLNNRVTRIDIPVQVIAYDFSYNYCDLIVDLSAVATNNQQLYIEFASKESNVYGYANGDSFIRKVDLNQQDFYDVQNYAYNFNINKLLEQAKFVFFDDKTIAAKKANQPQEDAFLNNFTGSGSAAASASDFSNMASAANDFSSGFSGGASYDNTFNFMNGDSDAWDWFTQQAADDLDSVQSGNNRRLMRSSSDTPLLDEYYNSIFGFLGGGS